jgi:hypothetical protein
MQPYSFAPDWGPNCLFKWQVILSKQITPTRRRACVVFLPQKRGLEGTALLSSGSALPDGF